jgi:hypothetical protein
MWSGVHVASLRVFANNIVLSVKSSCMATPFKRKPGYRMR